MNIYYGSQSGNCEEISKLLQDRIENECNISIKLNTLNSLEQLISTNNGVEGITHLFVVTSTYGNGDPPCNASKLWRLIKKRTTSEHLFKNVKFATLALGNSNYDKFCNFGKNINKRLEELGGERVLKLVCIDDVDGLDEEYVTSWCNDVIDLIRDKK